jgi:hypothetical protein
MMLVHQRLASRAAGKESMMIVYLNSTTYDLVSNVQVSPMPNSNVQDNIDDLFAKTQATLETLIV